MNYQLTVWFMYKNKATCDEKCSQRFFLKSPFPSGRKNPVQCDIVPISCCSEDEGGGGAAITKWRSRVF